MYTTDNKLEYFIGFVNEFTYVTGLLSANPNYLCLLGEGVYSYILQVS